MSQGSGVTVSCGVGHRHDLDPMLLCLWCRLAAAAPIRLLARELPYAAGEALKKNKKDIIVDFSHFCVYHSVAYRKNLQ